MGYHLPLEGVPQGLNGLFAEAVLPAEFLGEPCRVVALRNVDSLAAVATRHGNVDAELNVRWHALAPRDGAGPVPARAGGVIPFSASEFWLRPLFVLL